MFMSPETNHLSVFKEIFYFSIYSKEQIDTEVARVDLYYFTSDK